jgi:hypothetical protein
MALLEYASVGILGAAGYGVLEMLWRGRTHWSMLLLGGGCFLVLYGLANVASLPLWKKSLLGTACITTAELLAGIVLNLRLGWSVWDYSDQPLNLGGQICALYALYWFLLCVPAVWFCARLRRLFVRLYGSR